MKRVLLVINSNLVNAGVPNVLMKIIRNLYKNYHFDILVGNSKPGYFDKEFESFGGSIIRIDLPTYADGKFLFVRRGRIVYHAVKKLLNKNQYDIIHCHNGYESGYALKAASQYRVPIRIAHSHGTYLVKGKNLIAKIYKINAKKKIIRYSTVRLACSDVAGRTLFLEHEFENILNPINLDDYLLLRKEPHEGIVLLQIGYYCELKNQLFSINVLTELIKLGKDAILYLIGYDDGSGYITRIKNKIATENLFNRVIMLPSDYDKRTIFKKVDFLLMPSTSEGLPLAALEAQASHTFCIASEYVSMDADLGMYTRLSIDNHDDAEKWANWIAEHESYEESLDMDRIRNFCTETYINKIKHVYSRIRTINLQ